MQNAPSQMSEKVLNTPLKMEMNVRAKQYPNDVNSNKGMKVNFKSVSHNCNVMCKGNQKIIVFKRILGANYTC